MVMRYLMAFICTVVFFSVATAQKKEQLPRYQKHYVRERETASIIASNFGIKLKDFLLINDFPADVRLKPGQIVLIRQLKDGENVAEEKPYVEPKQRAETVSKPRDEDDTRGGEEKPVEVKKSAPAKTETKKAETTSKSYDDDETRSEEEKPVVAKKTTPAHTETKPAATTKSENTGGVDIGPNGVKYEISINGIHVVQKGQTFYHIALIYHLTANELKALNNMPNTDIRIGQELKVSK